MGFLLDEIKQRLRESATFFSKPELIAATLK